jgi:hypothetical protein
MGTSAQVVCGQTRTRRRGQLIISRENGNRAELLTTAAQLGDQTMTKHRRTPIDILAQMIVESSEKVDAELRALDFQERLYREAPAMLEACEKLIAYRDRAGAINFQLEKADDYIRMMRAVIARVKGE